MAAGDSRHEWSPWEPPFGTITRSGVVNYGVTASLGLGGADLATATVIAVASPSAGAEAWIIAMNRREVSLRDPRRRTGHNGNREAAIRSPRARNVPRVIVWLLVEACADGPPDSFLLHGLRKFDEGSSPPLDQMRVEEVSSGGGGDPRLAPTVNATSNGGLLVLFVHDLRAASYREAWQTNVEQDPSGEVSPSVPASTPSGPCAFRVAEWSSVASMGRVPISRHQIRSPSRQRPAASHRGGGSVQSRPGMIGNST